MFHVIMKHKHIVLWTYQPAPYGSPEEFFSSSGNSFSVSDQNYFLSSDYYSKTGEKSFFSGIIFLNSWFFFSFFICENTEK